MPIITIEQIIAVEDGSVINNLQVNGITAESHSITNKLLLLKTLAIYDSER